MNNLEQRIDDPTSYASLFKLLKSYRLSGGVNDTYSKDFNRLDSPAHLYFRIFFDFNTGLLDASQDLGDENEITNDNESGLSTYITPGGNKINTPKRIHNSAINYLVLNNEWERADYLRSFINLLSNISTYSPWYFQELGGVDEALNRKEFVETAFSIDEQEKNLTITCLPDAFDSRIGTLMDLYKAACFSYHLHKEIVPANLRRFNMYVYVFNTGIRGIHSKTEVSQNFGEKSIYKSDATIDQRILPEKGSKGVPELYVASSKLIEFHECEFSYNSAATGYASMNNTDGFEQKYIIGIKYKYAVEQRYNNIIQRVIGDFVLNDFKSNNPNYWKKEDAAAANTTFTKDNRETTELDTSMLDIEKPKSDTEESNNNSQYYGISGEYYESRKKEDNSLGVKLFVDANKPDSLDPWKQLAKNKIDDAMRGINQTIQAGKSAIESWTDTNKLNKNIINAVDRLTYGNLFTVNMMDIPRLANKTIGNLRSDSIINRITPHGWSQVNRSTPDSSI